LFVYSSAPYFSSSSACALFSWHEAHYK
jgi:hypothetical protein